MAKEEEPTIRSFTSADSTLAAPGLEVAIVTAGGLSFERAVFAPGWRWSEGRDGLCQERHHGLLLAGQMGFRLADGRELVASAGDVYLIPPGHDAWVVGDVECVAIDLVVQDRPG